MDDDEVHQFQAKQHPLFDELEQGLPLMKIWIVPGKDKDVAYIVTKHYHQLSDGMSLIQMFSLMQDGGDAVTKGSNQIIYPARQNVSLTTMMSKYKQLEEMDSANAVLMEETDQLLGNRNEGLQTPERVLFVTGDMSLAELKRRAKKLLEI